MDEHNAWVFVGEGAKLPCGTFSSLAKADEVIGRLKLTGLLTSYPVDEIVYEWAINKRYFNPSRPPTSKCRVKDWGTLVILAEKTSKTKMAVH